MAIIISKVLKRPDPRTLGSNNPGATNMLRLHGKAIALLTLFGDVLKGYLPTIYVSYAYPDSMAFAILAVFLGHLYPIFFKFKGGKGVATAFGLILGLDGLLGLGLALAWLLTAICFRYSSLASLVAAILAPIVMFGVLGKAELISLTIISLLIIYRHQSNIRKLISGQESRLKLFS